MRRASRSKGTKAPTQEEFQKVLRSIQRRPENKHCCDCTERLPQYVNLEFNTFVCMNCSGVHRELNHRVKGITLSNFSEEEVRNLQQGGNQACNDLYLAKYDPSRDMKEPDGLNVGNRRKFMFAKYKEKRWYGTTEDLVRDIEEREAVERSKEARLAPRRKSSGRQVPKSSQPTSDVVAKSNVGRGTKQVTNMAEANQNAGNYNFLDLISPSPARGGGGVRLNHHYPKDNNHNSNDNWSKKSGIHLRMLKSLEGNNPFILMFHRCSTLWMEDNIIVSPVLLLPCNLYPLAFWHLHQCTNKYIISNTSRHRHNKELLWEEMHTLLGTPASRFKHCMASNNNISCTKFIPHGLELVTMIM